ncbi:trypsin-like [Copidosoma floridanum]|uniref:trypsin-like n=1 Tax=Copidosoma floridanum TaxID=29053 RepID=UPI0006C950A6|nr:trypsin-like [Copidosoma floridanum]
MASFLPIWIALTFISIVSGLDSENIIGGQNGNINDFPYLAFIRVNYEHGGGLCGGALIRRQFILTSTSCIRRAMDNSRGLAPNTVYIKVHVGTSDLTSSTQGGVIRVKEIYLHKEYKRLDVASTNDIAVLKLELEVPRRLTATAVNLPPADEPILGGSSLVSGFGYNSIQVENRGGRLVETGHTADKKLKFVKVNVIPLIQCGIPKSVIKTEHLLHKLFCGKVVPAVRNLDHYGTCSGDGGGPLVKNGKIIGVLSTGPFDCNESQLPAFYTQVSAYLDFINPILAGKPGPATKVYESQFPPARRN